jgi:hypothetical protein
MAFSKSFENELDKLFRQRTYWLRIELGKPQPGKPRTFNRKVVNEGIQRLQDIASDKLIRWLAKREFNKHIARRKNYTIRGRGPAGKRAGFERWFAKSFMKTKGLIYAFWGRNGKCIYIGQTGSHGRRPSSHFEKYWFARVTRVTIFVISGKSHIPKLECLAIHHFQPTINKNKAATKKWTKACPLCTTHKYIETELRKIFRFR